MTVTPEAAELAHTASVSAVSAIDDAIAAETAASLDDLAENAVARSNLRRQVNKREFRLAIHDLAEGLRGIVRVAPVTAVLAGVAAGLMIGKRRRRHVRRAP